MPTKTNKKVGALFYIVAILILSILFIFFIFNSAKIHKDTSALPSEYKKVPVVMYHSIYSNPKSPSDYIISPNDFEQDLIYIRDNNFTTITSKELIDYAYNNKPLPEKPIVLTFDDGYYNNYLYAFPLLKKYNMSGVIGVVGKFSEDYSKIDENVASYSHCTWSQLKEMTQDNTFEIANHTYNLHAIKNGRKGCNIKKGENINSYTELLHNDITTFESLISENVGVKPVCYIYPFGAFSDSTEKIVKQNGYKLTFICYDEISKISPTPDSLYQIKRYLRTNKHSVEKYINQYYNKK